MKKYCYVLLLLVCLSSCKSETKIVEEMDHFKISRGDFELAASEIENMESSYMVVGWGDWTDGLYMDAGISCIPLDRVESLREQYGNFMRCSNPGAPIAQRSTVELEIILSDSSYKTTLDKVKKSKKDHMYPVISVTGRVIRIDSATYKNGPFYMSSTPSTVVLANSVEMEKENYSF